jgi:hypothetical protein
MAKENITRLAAIILGLFCATAFYRSPFLLGLESSLLALISFLILAPLTAFIFKMHKKPYILVLIFMLIGVSAGGVVDVALDDESRNLFPLEIAYLCLIFSPGVFAGLVAAWLLDKAVHNKSLKSGTPQSGAH